MTKASERGGAGEAGRRKMTQGRQKIPMKRIENQDARQVCFSKRRSGLFKKASELSALCGAHVVVLVFSPAKKPYSFGHPSVHAVIDRFLDPSSADYAAAEAATHPAVVCEFNRQEEHLTKALEEQAFRKAALEKEACRRRAALEERLAAGVWTNDGVQCLELPDLEPLLAALESVQAEAAKRYHDIIAEQTMMQCTGSGAGSLVHYLSAGTFTVDVTGGSHEAVIDTKMMWMGDNVGHALAPALPFAPMMPPPPPHFNHGFGYNNLNLSTGYGYNLGVGDGDGDGHGPVYEMEAGYYGTTCDFFGQE